MKITFECVTKIAQSMINILMFYQILSIQKSLPSLTFLKESKQRTSEEKVGVRYSVNFVPAVIFG